MLFVEAHGGFEGQGGVQRDSLAAFGTQPGFDCGQQFCSDTGAVPVRQNGHSAQVAFSGIGIGRICFAPVCIGHIRIAHVRSGNIRTAQVRIGDVRIAQAGDRAYDLAVCDGDHDMHLLEAEVDGFVG